MRLERGARGRRDGGLGGSTDVGLLAVLLGRRGRDRDDPRGRRERGGADAGGGSGSGDRGRSYGPDRRRGRACGLRRL